MPIAIAVLNQGLRPLLSKWHPELVAYEATRPPNVSPIEHERAWSRGTRFVSLTATTRMTIEGPYGRGGGEVWARGR